MKNKKIDFKKIDLTKVKDFNKKIQNNKKKSAITLFASISALVFVTVITSAILSLHPYAIVLDDSNLCYVKSEASANRVIDKLVNDYSVKDTTIKSIDTQDRLKIERSDRFRVEEKEVKTINEAVELIKAKTEEKTENPLQITIASAKTELEPYTPEPNYQRDDTLLAGESVVIKEGKAGTQKVSTTYTTLNGEVIGSGQSASQVVDEGEKATVAKGTLGLPDGEDWRTYVGDPVFKDGAELTITASKYIGKVRYKLGGYDLNRGVSCLGLVKAIYAKYGIYLPMSHSGMKKAGVGVSYKNAQKGDIICYRSHVGIYIGDGKMIDATSSKGVSIRPVSTSKLVTVRRVANK